MPLWETSAAALDGETAERSPCLAEGEPGGRLRLPIGLRAPLHKDPQVPITAESGGLFLRRRLTEISVSMGETS